MIPSPECSRCEGPLNPFDCFKDTANDMANVCLPCTDKAIDAALAADPYAVMKALAAQIFDLTCSV